MESSSFLDRLKSLVLGHPVLEHRIWSALEHGPFDRNALCTFTVYYYHHVLRTRLYGAAALACCPAEAIQAALASILWDEYGAGDVTRSHPEQFRRVLRALGIDVAEAERHPRLPELEEYSRLHFGLCTPDTFWKAMGAVGFAMEWPIPHLYRPLVRAYRRIAGLSEGDLEFYLEHIPTDENHASLIISSVLPFLNKQSVQDQILEGALRSMDARGRLVEAIYRRMDTPVPRGEPIVSPPM